MLSQHHGSLQEAGTYPLDTPGSLLQVKSSGVHLDLDGYSLNNKNEKDLVIGIEVGYSQADLDAHPELQQVSNIVIKNGYFKGFDVGIVVHQGVNNVVIQDCSFESVSVGIALPGKVSDRQDRTTRVQIKDSVIIGHGLDKQEKIVLLKKKIEGLEAQGYGYGVDTFMPLLQDPLDENKKMYIVMLGFWHIVYQGCLCKMLEYKKLVIMGLQN